MSPKKSTINTPTAPNRDAVLRSINIEFDIAEPVRIRHYRPTSKSSKVLRALMGMGSSRCFLVVAPYGSGKSISATYAAAMMQGRDDAWVELSETVGQLATISPDLADLLRLRRRKKARGLVIVLSGEEGSLPHAILDAAIAGFKRLHLGRQVRSLSNLTKAGDVTIKNVLETVQSMAEQNKVDRVLLVWDEFGRHLERLISDGRAAELSDLQTMAEWVSRTGSLPFTFALLLHRELLNYASDLPQSIRNEWRKIEGRFETLHYIEDSKELLRLAGEVISSRRLKSTPHRKTIEQAARRARKLALFRQFRQADLEELFSNAYPLEPVTLMLLPRLSARVAQNERTLFHFLYEANLEGLVDLGQLYDFFAPLMQHDTAVGGTYRQWLEAESALSKVEADSLEAKVLKASCLLGLGMAGERSRISRETLTFAVEGLDREEKSRSAIDSLIERKLLLYRRHNDDLSIWHGTDQDLRSRLAEEKDRLRDSFDALTFLEKEYPPPIRMPLAYNDEFSIRRYFTASYIDPSGLKKHGSLGLPHKRTGDGHILHVLLTTQGEKAEMITLAKELTAGDLQLVITMPQEALEYRQTALEIAALNRMQQDADLVGADPLIVPELQQMADDARAHLERILDRALAPKQGGPTWVHGGNVFAAVTTRQLTSKLSDVMREIYPTTPKVNNEMIVRRKPSAVVVNARKKLIMGILERSGKENLGIKGNFPDASMFRTVLLQTGLYQQTADGRWIWMQPESIPDKGVREVWEKLRAFVQEPSPQPKTFSDLFETLSAPPIGLREGLLPILLAAAMQAFPSLRCLTFDGNYVPDILPSQVEAICKQPHRFALEVVPQPEARDRYLKGVLEVFRGGEESSSQDEVDLIRSCFDAIEQWKQGLPPSALSARDLSEQAANFQDAIRGGRVPTDLLFGRLTKALNGTIDEFETLLGKLRSARDEVEGIQTRYEQQAKEEFLSAICWAPDDGADLRDEVLKWLAVLPSDLGLDEPSRQFISRLQVRYQTDRALLDSIGGLLVGRRIVQWDQGYLNQFGDLVRLRVERIEKQAVLQAEQLTGEQRETVVRMIRRRIERMTELVDNLEHLGLKMTKATRKRA